MQKFLISYAILCLFPVIWTHAVPAADPRTGVDAALPYSYTNETGPFIMSWGFSGNGTDEIITIEFTLPSEIYIGIGLGCETSAQCDMIVGNGGGGNPAFITDYFEAHGDRLPFTDVELGGTDDVTLIAATYNNDKYASTLRFTRKLNTGDKFDFKLSKSVTPMVYAWCDGSSFCDSLESAHAPGDWNIIEVDLSGRGANASALNTKTNSDDECYAGSEVLCGCSQLIKRHVIKSFDDCTQQTAIAYCKEGGRCDY